MIARALVLALLVVAGCGDDTTTAGPGTDLAVAAGPDMQLLSRCGHPGDVGNSLGVGKFCTNTGPDCTGNGKATTCSALFNGQPPSPTDTYFCAFQCTMSDPPDVCGENATCLCNASNLCACIPTKCVPPGDGGA
jgi:hypothetical protein